MRWWTMKSILVAKTLPLHQLFPRVQERSPQGPGILYFILLNRRCIHVFRASETEAQGCPQEHSSKNLLEFVGNALQRYTNFSLSALSRFLIDEHCKTSYEIFQANWLCLQIFDSGTNAASIHSTQKQLNYAAPKGSGILEKERFGKPSSILWKGNENATRK